MEKFKAIERELFELERNNEISKTKLKQAEQAILHKLVTNYHKILQQPAAKNEITVTEDGTTVLHLAVAKGRYFLLEKLIEFDEVFSPIHVYQSADISLSKSLASKRKSALEYAFILSNKKAVLTILRNNSAYMDFSKPMWWYRIFDHVLNPYDCVKYDSIFRDIIAYAVEKNNKTLTYLIIDLVGKMKLAVFIKEIGKIPERLLKLNNVYSVADGYILSRFIICAYNENNYEVYKIHQFFKCLLKKGANPNLKKNKTSTVIEILINKKKHELLKIVLKESQFAINYNVLDTNGSDVFVQILKLLVGKKIAENKVKTANLMLNYNNKLSPAALDFIRANFVNAPKDELFTNMLEFLSAENKKCLFPLLQERKGMLPITAASQYKFITNFNEYNQKLYDSIVKSRLFPKVVNEKIMNFLYPNFMPDSSKKSVSRINNRVQNSDKKGFHNKLNQNNHAYYKLEEPENNDNCCRCSIM